MKKYFEEKKLFIESELDNFWQEKADQKYIENIAGNYDFDFDMDAWHEFAGKPVSDMLATGGKRLRPVLACLIHDLFDGKRTQIGKLAIIPELVHNGTLIIDDIEDRSQLRRGQKCVHHMIGENLAINCGNLLYFWPQTILYKADISDKTKLEIAEMINHELIKVHLGQGMDILWSNQKKYEVAEKQYMQMSAYKTSALLGMAMKIGALSAEADEKYVKILEQVAIKIGIAYQIKDDILNLKPGEKWGKETGEDITEGKITLLLIDGYARANNVDKNMIRNIWSAHTKEKDMIKKGIQILEKYDCFTRGEKKANRLIDEAKSMVKDNLPENTYQNILIQFFDYLKSRTN